MGRNAAGVRGMRLSPSDSIVTAGVIKKNYKNVNIMTLSEKGYGKKSSVKDYKVQNRGGTGIKTAKVSDKTGTLIAGAITNGQEEELVAISKKGQVIRVALQEIPVLGRQTQGVRIMKVRSGDALATFTCI